jgi:hypothetical protein
VIAVGLISGFDQAEAIVATGDADLIALARAILFDPRWPWHAAAELGAQVRVPNQYLRSEPRRFKGLLAPARPAMAESVKERRTANGRTLHRPAEKRA